MVLSDGDIKKYLKKGLVIKPFKKLFLQPSTYDLRLGDEVRVFDNYKTGLVDVRKKADLTRLVKLDGGGFVIHPGDFVLGATKEYFEIPGELCAKLEGRSSLGRLGLVVHATAGYIDPGFKGWITFELGNLSRVPIKIYKGMRIAQICFLKMSRVPDRLYGDSLIGNKYQGQKGPTASRFWKDYEKR
ncbi:dCTP deaminase [Candidatus Shapirobacteria bacterium]|nr:MAG: dCTP deaminase [Candidatus Shapirobacteria bacterium]